MLRTVMSGVLLAILALALAKPALADEVVLHDGRAFDVDIVQTEVDSVTVKFQKDGSSGTVKVRAAELDPHSFYGIRNRLMEKTALNHLQLAKFAAEAGLFARAKGQVEKARALDAEFVERKLALPGLVEGVANNILDKALGFFKAGDYENAQRYAATVLNDFPETPAHEKASKLIDRIDKKVMQADEEKRQQAIAAVSDNQEQMREKLEKEVRPLIKLYEAARKLNNDALKEKSQSKSVDMFEAAGKRFEAVLKQAMGVRKKHADDKFLLGEIDRGIAMVKNDAIDAWVNAGGVELGRGSMNKAQEYASRALKIDPESSAAKALRTRIELASAISDKYYRTRRR